MTQLTEQRPEVRSQGSEVSDQIPEIAPRQVATNRSWVLGSSVVKIALLTGGGDKPYALGMAAALTSAGIRVDFIGSDDLSVPELFNNPRLKFLNLRGDQSSEAGLPAKVQRILSYYAKLILYATTAQPKLFHLLWNNK